MADFFYFYKWNLEDVKKLTLAEVLKYHAILRIQIEKYRGN